MDINDSVLSMAKGWVICYNDGKVITEYVQNEVENSWRSVPKTNIKSLSLKWMNKHWTIPGPGPFIVPYKRAWNSPGMSENIIEYRCIGYWEGNNKVIYKVDEATGKMSILVESIKKEE
jgi:hypothetical protein